MVTDRLLSGAVFQLETEYSVRSRKSESAGDHEMSTQLLLSYVVKDSKKSP